MQILWEKKCLDGYSGFGIWGRLRWWFIYGEFSGNSTKKLPHSSAQCKFSVWRVCVLAYIYRNYFIFSWESAKGRQLADCLFSLGPAASFGPWTSQFINYFFHFLLKPQIYFNEFFSFYIFCVFCNLVFFCVLS
jgi:hypothetical protein